MSYVTKFRNEEIEQVTDSEGNTMYFSIGSLGASDALRAQLKLQKALGPMLLSLSAGSAESLMKDKEAMFGVMNALERMWEHETDMFWLLGKFCSVTQYSHDGASYAVMAPPGNPGPNGFDEVFSANGEMMYRWMVKHLEKNFKFFFNFSKSAKSEEEPTSKSRKGRG